MIRRFIVAKYEILGLKADQFPRRQRLHYVLAQIVVSTPLRIVSENASIATGPAMDTAAGFSPNLLRQPRSAVNLQMANVANQSVQMVTTIERPVLVCAECVRLRRPSRASIFQKTPKPVLSTCRGDSLTCKCKSGEPIPRISPVQFAEPTSERINERILGPAMPTVRADEVGSGVFAAFVGSRTVRTIRLTQ